MNDRKLGGLEAVVPIILFFLFLAGTSKSSFLVVLCWAFRKLSVSWLELNGKWRVFECPCPSSVSPHYSWMRMVVQKRTLFFVCLHPWKMLRGPTNWKKQKNKTKTKVKQSKCFHGQGLVKQNLTKHANCLLSCRDNSTLNVFRCQATVILRQGHWNESISYDMSCVSLPLWLPWLKYCPRYYY